MSQLFTAAELGDFMQTQVSVETAVQVERVVWGWLKGPLDLTERPDPVPEEVFSWALELAAIAHENPAGLESYQLGAERAQYGTERRVAILAEAGSSSDGASGTSPVGSFPAALCWPDPIRF